MPTTQTNYQKLQKDNLIAARLIALRLKSDKAISEETFRTIYQNARGIRYRNGSFDKLLETTKKFLKQHGVMTFSQANGFNLWLATPKCVYTKIENMFVEYQYVSNEDIDKAIAYQKINAGLINPESEGKVIATNILGLTGKTAEIYVKVYVFHLEGIRETAGRIDTKYAILGPIREMKEIKKI
jgi:hypothetical protein